MKTKTTWALALGILASTLALGGRAEAQTGYTFVPIIPCRAVDTRYTSYQPYNGPPQVTGAARAFQIRGRCGVPSTAQAVSVTLTVASPAGPGFVGIWPAGSAYPNVSNLNFSGGESAVANGAVSMLGPNTSVTDLLAVSGVTNTDVIIDVVGYYK